MHFKEIEKLTIFVFFFNFFFNKRGYQTAIENETKLKFYFSYLFFIATNIYTYLTFNNRERRLIYSQV
jgi:hypothetical protein